MNSRAGRVLAGLGVVAVAVVLFVVLSNGDDGDSGDGGKAGTGIESNGGVGDNSGASSNAAKVPTIAIENGEPVGGIEELSYEKGDQIHFKVESDVADEVHVHGYDLAKDVEAGGTVSFDFPATIEGVFEAELEERKEQILELRVEP
jgi:hypothetical protein